MGRNEDSAVRFAERAELASAPGSHEELATMKTLRKPVRGIGLDAT